MCKENICFRPGRSVVPGCSKIRSLRARLRRGFRYTLDAAADRRAEPIQAAYRHDIELPKLSLYERGLHELTDAVVVAYGGILANLGVGTATARRRVMSLRSLLRFGGKSATSTSGLPPRASRALVLIRVIHPVPKHPDMCPRGVRKGCVAATESTSHGRPCFGPACHDAGLITAV